MQKGSWNGDWEIKERGGEEKVEIGEKMRRRMDINEVGKVVY